MPRSTIVVPTYNVANTIADTLHSPLAQTDQDFEIIGVDDGSSDKTLNVVFDLIERTETNLIRVIRQANRCLEQRPIKRSHWIGGSCSPFIELEQLHPILSDRDLR